MYSIDGKTISNTTPVSKCGCCGLSHEPKDHYICSDLKDIEGFPNCDFDCEGHNRAKLNLGPRRKFYVCGKVGGWLLSRGVSEEELG